MLKRGMGAELYQVPTFLSLAKERKRAGCSIVVNEKGMIVIGKADIAWQAIPMHKASLMEGGYGFGCGIIDACFLVGRGLFQPLAYVGIWYFLIDKEDYI